jgi:hypothetical protein
MMLMFTSDASTAPGQRIESPANHDSLIRSPRQRLRIIECTSNIQHLVVAPPLSTLHSLTTNTPTHTHTPRHVLYNKASVGHGPARYVFAPRHSTTTATRRLTTAQRDRPPPFSPSASPMPPSFPPRAQSLLRLLLRRPAWCLAHRVRHPQ